MLVSKIVWYVIMEYVVFVYMDQLNENKLLFNLKPTLYLPTNTLLLLK